ncbi:MAG: hypothetical protein ISP90_16085 [Nevskia sp.]|nr:hypothetical protein [Nevskia sp.]
MPPLFTPKNALQSAQGGAQTRRFREFVIAHFDGEGAISVPNTVWIPAAAWASSRMASGNRLRDRGLLIQRLDVFVTRRGTSIASTTGAHLRLAKLRDAMKSEGVDVKEWNFPPDDVLDRALNPGGGGSGRGAHGHPAAGDAAPAADKPAEPDTK